MSLFDLFEKLINERGSAAILSQHLAFVRAQHEALERQCADLQAENAALKAQLEQLQAGKPSPYTCDHCGSVDLDRTGNRPDPTFGDLGVKQALFRCRRCGQQSAFTLA
ncbi:MAG: bZIP transcription factor [Porticoccaceae bacterium]|nr:bZIP transcription factor [Porticoccaceae bacterium]